jgi:hypothetical protein
LTNSQKNPQTLNFIKICPVGVEFFQMYRQADMMKLIVAFWNFVNVPNNSSENRRQESIGLSYSCFMSERSIK